MEIQLDFFKGYSLQEKLRVIAVGGCQCRRPKLGGIGQEGVVRDMTKQGHPSPAQSAVSQANPKTFPSQPGANQASTTPATRDRPESSQEATISTRLLVVDDERPIRAACETIAQSVGYSTVSAQSADEALRFLGTQPFDVVLMDLRMPGMSGLEALDRIRTSYPDVVVVMMTGYGSIESAVEAMKKGAYDYITKPFHVEELRLLLRRIDKHLQMTAENRVLREQMHSSGGFSLMVGRSPEMQKLFRVVGRAAFSAHPVLILGESGTGKEVLARSIHISGPNREKPFLPVDCGSLIPSLLESELFGHVKGAVPGTTTSKEGMLAVADGGTLFLDDIAEMQLDLQAKLLRAIQEKEIRPIGSTKAIPINVRILAATAQDIDRAVAEGRFRQDLYFRLNVLSIRIPPLRERREDIPVLAGYFLQHVGQQDGLRHAISDEALKKLLEYEWPGNIRELENCIERACSMSSGTTIRVADLPATIRDWQAATIDKPKEEALTLAEIEKRAILGTIEKMNGDKLKAARALGIGRTTLYRKLSEYEQGGE